jgi:hypothetical protein
MPLVTVQRIELRYNPPEAVANTSCYLAAVLRRMKAFRSRIIPAGCWETEAICCLQREGNPGRSRRQIQGVFHAAELGVDSVEVVKDKIIMMAGPARLTRMHGPLNSSCTYSFKSLRLCCPG